MAEFEDNMLNEQFQAEKVKFYLLAESWFSFFAGIASTVSTTYNLLAVIAGTVVLSAYLIVPSLLLMAIGVICPGIAVFGCYAAKKESMLNLRRCTIAMAILMLISLAVGMYTMTASFIDTDNKNISLKDAIKNFHEDVSMKDYITSIQRVFHCCGQEGIDDWNGNDLFSCNRLNYNDDRCSVPPSCCIRKEKYFHPLNCGMDTLNVSSLQNKHRKDIVYEDGCQKKMDYFILGATLNILIMLILLIISQVLLCRRFGKLIHIYGRQNRRRNLLIYQPHIIQNVF